MYGLYLLHQEMIYSEILDKFWKLPNGSTIHFSPMELKELPAHIEIIDDGSIPQPITDSTHEHNCKSRLVYCSNCKYELTTSLPGPKCGICHSWLITSIR